MNNRPDTLNAIIGLLNGTKTSRKVFGGLPKKEEVVALLAERGIESQLTGSTVTDADWRNEGLDSEGNQDCLYVWLRLDDESEECTVAAVFDYGNDEFSYC